MAGIWFISEGDAERLRIIYDVLRKLDIKWKSAGRCFIDNCIYQNTFT